MELENEQRRKRKEMKTEIQTYLIQIECPFGTGDLTKDIAKELQDFVCDEVRATNFLIKRK
jgi:uncharacterized protein YggL (DUF469 family)